MKIIIICGGNSLEKEISVKSGMSIFTSVKKKYESEILLLNNDYTIIKDSYNDGDLIFNALHGGYGENGEIQEFFEVEGMSFIGSGSEACKIAINKDRCKKIALELGLNTPFGKIFNDDFSVFEEFSTPFIIKPNMQGSSVGFSIINNKKEMLKSLKKANQQEIIFEEFIRGREITVSILDGEVLPIVEIVPKGGVYDYESKYVKGKTDYIVPARIDLDLEKVIKDKTLELFKRINCKHYSRVDYILSEENIPFFLEINTSPGMTETSLFPKSGKGANLSFDELVEKIISLK